VVLPIVRTGDGCAARDAGALFGPTVLQGTCTREAATNWACAIDWRRVPRLFAPPSYHQPFVFVDSLIGDVFAMHEVSGLQRWKYSCGFPVTRAPAGGRRPGVCDVR